MLTYWELGKRYELGDQVIPQGDLLTIDRALTCVHAGTSGHQGRAPNLDAFGTRTPDGLDGLEWEVEAVRRPPPVAAPAHPFAPVVDEPIASVTKPSSVVI